MTRKLVHVRRAGDDRLGAADDDAVGPPLLDVHVDVGIGLLARALGAVALGVGHGDAERQVLVLDLMQVGEEALVIVGAAVVVGSAASPARWR